MIFDSTRLVFVGRVFRTAQLTTHNKETSMTHSLNAAVIGLGSMGWGAAVSLLRAGVPTTGVDIASQV